MKKEKDAMNISPQNFFCINCASFDGTLVPAAHLMWDSECQICSPLCQECYQFTVATYKLLDEFNEN